MIQNQKVFYLVGMAGVGKSVIGLGTAKLLSLCFKDLDNEIVKREKMSISKIIATKKETYFREIEQKTLKLTQFDSYGSCILATGGGTPAFFENMDFMLSNGIVVWLHVPLEEIISRLEKSSDDRPLYRATQSKEFRQVVTEIYQKRELFYAKSHFKIDSSDYDINVINNLAHIIKCN